MSSILALDRVLPLSQNISDCVISLFKAIPVSQKLQLLMSSEHDPQIRQYEGYYI